MQLYSQILDHAGPAFGVILRHLRDKPEQGCLFHCTGTVYDSFCVSPRCSTDLLIICFLFQPVKTGQAFWQHCC